VAMIGLTGAFFGCGPGKNLSDLAGASQKTIA
jgi:hypothetical protein